MTWYAQQVFATPQPSVVAAITALPGLEGAVYHVPHLHDLQREEQVVDGVILSDDGPKGLLRTVTSGPHLPSDGLVVIRELCDPEEGPVEWFGDSGRSWSPLEALGSGLRASYADYDFLFEGAPEWWKDVAPPPPVLAVFEEIARQTGTLISYFCHHMWGGDTECSFGWTWDGERTESAFYRAAMARDADGKEATGFYTDSTGAFSICGNHRRLIVDGDVLTLILIHHGLLLRDGYFELHTRRFPWERYRV